MSSVVAETTELTSTFNLQDYISVFKDVQGLGECLDAMHHRFEDYISVFKDVQGLSERLDAMHRRFEVIMEMVLMARDVKRRQQWENNDTAGHLATGTYMKRITVERGLSGLVNNSDLLQKRQWPRRRCVCTQRPLVVKWSLEQCKESGYDIPVGAAVFMNVSRSATKQLEFRHEEVPGGGHERRDAVYRGPTELT
ncbi:hypothetical protein VPH35_015389 [Triticum aestivum]|uniref:Uncharacterized protein n=1 Tax=Aegilops tauschii TaxID=37682 RepID=N1R0Y5_AEGTA